MKQSYDACIVGSGASGGVAAKVLTAGGMRVCMLEAGPMVDPALDFKQHMWPYEFPRRGLSRDGESDGLMAANGFWSIDGEPYTRTADSAFSWFRSRVVGGRTNHWGQGASRLASADLEARSVDGGEDQWPITYKELEPYYDSVELDIGVYGSPRFPDLMPAPVPRCTELFVKRAADRAGLKCEVAPGSVLTKQYRGRPACHYCGQCWRGCRDRSNYSSSQLHIPEAIRTGRLSLVTNAMAREIVVRPDGSLKGVCYIDKAARTEERIDAPVVIVAASACESARLLLNSKSALFPQGLANSSGMVGRNLRDSITSRGEAYFPQLESIGPHNHDGTGRPHLWIPAGKLPCDEHNVSRNFHIFFIGGKYMPALSDFDIICDREQGYGVRLKQVCKKAYGAMINFVATGEMLSNPYSFCEINDDVVDDWGIPVLRFHFKWGQNEYRMAKAMQDSIRALVEAAGGQYLTRVTEQGPWAYGISAGGQSFHEQGTTRMGKDSRKSVLNSFCQAHDVRQLFVVDAGGFVTGSAKPPTLTIMALAWRAAEYILDQAAHGEL